MTRDPDDPFDVGDSISVMWHVEDVFQVAPDLTLPQARRVLLYLREEHDPNNGITWESIEYLASVVRGEDEGIL